VEKILVKYCNERIYAQNIENIGVTEGKFGSGGGGEELLKDKIAENHTTFSLLASRTGARLNVTGVVWKSAGSAVASINRGAATTPAVIIGG
jgi:hypothetical protein